MTKQQIAVEICINCLTDTAVMRDVAVAYRGGACRVELCRDMGQDGLTPYAEQMAVARTAFGERAGLLVMIRPRGGGFAYSRNEVDLMLAQMDTAVSAGADGVVLGALQGDALDLIAMRRLTQYARDLDLVVTCHRAFDAVAEQAEALEMLLDLGVQRVLTSGTKWGTGLSALDGVIQLTKLIEQANNRLEIVVGGGVNLGNVQVLLAQLPLDVGRLAVHVYSGVLQDGCVDETAVAQLVQSVAKLS